MPYDVAGESPAARSNVVWLDGGSTASCVWLFGGCNLNRGTLFNDTWQFWPCDGLGNGIYVHGVNFKWWWTERKQ